MCCNAPTLNLCSVEMLCYITTFGLLLVLASTDAQFTNVGSCSAADVTAVVARIPGNESCNMAAYRIVNVGNLGLSIDDIANDLVIACNGECGGRLSTFLATCGTEGLSTAYLLTLSCLSHSEDATCVEQLPPLLNVTYFNNAQSCLTYEPGMDCPAGCAEPLSQIINQMGCCYRPLYGNSDVQM